MKTELGKNLLYLARRDVEKIDISMSEIISALEEMFIEKGNGNVEMPPKPGIHTRTNAFIHAMPAYIPSMNSAGVKWISGYPDNSKKGLPYITGLLILNDPETGIPIAIMDATWITAQRTGAASALSAKYLARKNSSSVGIIACGVQGRSNLEALSCLFNLKKVKAYDINPSTVKKFADEMGKQLNLNIEPVTDLNEAVKDLDMVVTSGPILKNPNPPIEAGWLRKGSYASLVDFDSFWQGKALAEADKIATDDHGQFNYYKNVGYFKETPQPYADLGEIVAGLKPGRESENEITMAVNLGIALDDMATAIMIYKKAIELGIGNILQL